MVPEGGEREQGEVSLFKKNREGGVKMAEE